MLFYPFSQISLFDQAFDFFLQMPALVSVVARGLMEFTVFLLVLDLTRCQGLWLSKGDLVLADFIDLLDGSVQGGIGPVRLIIGERGRPVC